jgi:predicted oxidoreductase
MNIGGTWDDAPIDQETEQRAFDALDRALVEGFTIFDHADIYANGKSEEVFGRWMRRGGATRDSLVIQTKRGIVPGETVRYDFSRDHIVRSVERPLRRLGVEYIDVLLLHRPDPLVEPEEVAEAFDYLHGVGMVRAFGVSNHSAMQIELLDATVDHPLIANQVEVSLAHPDLITAGTAINQRAPDHPHRDADTIEFCRIAGITLQAWSPLARGLYSGRETSAAADLVSELAASYGVSREAIVVAWVMRHPAPILPVVGTTNPERIAATAQADSITLERDDWYRLLAAARGREMP